MARNSAETGRWGWGAGVGGLLAAAMLAVAVGCTEEVVGVRNPSNDTRWDYERQNSPNSSLGGGGSGPLEAMGEGIEGVGDLLFGWMGNESQGVRYSPGETKDLDLGDRYGPAVQSNPQ